VSIEPSTKCSEFILSSAILVPLTASAFILAVVIALSGILAVVTASLASLFVVTELSAILVAAIAQLVLNCL
jgi:hypothetical protein